MGLDGDTRREFLKKSILGSTAFLLGLRNAQAKNTVELSWVINDSKGSPIQGAQIQATHQMNPNLTYSAATNPSGYAKISDVATAIKDTVKNPQDYHLHQNYPNPFNPTTTMEFYTGKPGDVRLDIFNTKGQLVRTLIEQYLPAGGHKIQWGGKDNYGTATGSGTYLARLRAGDYTKTIKMVKVDGGSADAQETVFSTPGARPNLRKTTAGDTYDVIITKDGFVPITEEITVTGPEHYDRTLEQQMKEVYLIDNQSLTEVKGFVEVDGIIYESDDNGKVEIPKSATELKAYSTKDGAVNSFVHTRSDLPTDSEHPLGIMLTTYNNLTELEQGVTPELFVQFMEEGNMGYKDAPAHGLRAVDFQHATNPVPNPDGPHGYVFWIDSDFYSRLNPDAFGTLSTEEQEYIANVIQTQIIDKIKEDHHKIPIYFAQPGEDHLIEDNPTGGKRAAPGVIPVKKKLGVGGYQFSWADYDPEDGIIDVPYPTVGEPSNYDHGIIEECGSFIMPNSIYNSDLADKTIFSELGGGDGLYPADLKALAIEENVSKYFAWKEHTLDSGVTVLRGYYQPLSHIDNFLKVKD